MIKDRIQYLFERYDLHLATESETSELFQLLEDPANRESINALFIEGIKGEREIELAHEYWDRVIQSIINAMPNDEPEPSLHRVPRKVYLMRWAAVACFMLFAVLGILFLARQMNNDDNRRLVISRFGNDVHPGTKAPVLKLADGRVMVLDSNKNGALAMEEGVAITRNSNGEVVYSNIQATQPVKNTLINPRGSRVIALTLADGTRVWLDAGSTITYPTAFTGVERRVEVTGQAYFEVSGYRLQVPGGKSEGRKIPFVVVAGRMETFVLGTRFNVEAFMEDEAARITLLEGKVRVDADGGRGEGKQLTLKPGQQAIARKGSALQMDASPDLEGAMAWKNGIFKFEDITIEPLMRQLARWYDVEVVYEDLPTDRFVSTIPRDVPASQVFKILETTGRVKFRIEGKKIIVMK